MIVGVEAKPTLAVEHELALTVDKNHIAALEPRIFILIRVHFFNQGAGAFEGEILTDFFLETITRTNGY
jgi:hypothetical protein